MTSQMMKNTTINLLNASKLERNAAKIMAKTMRCIPYLSGEKSNEQNMRKQEKQFYLQDYLQSQSKYLDFLKKINLLEKDLFAKKLFHNSLQGQIETIPPQRFRKMPLEEIQEILLAQKEQLTTAQTITLFLSRSWMLNEDLLKKIPAEEIAKIPPSYLQKIPPRQLMRMSCEQFQRISPEQIRSLRPVQMCALNEEHIYAMSREQIQSLLPEQIAAFNPDQIFFLVASEKLGSMNEKQFMQMPRQVRKKIRQLKDVFFRKRNKERENRL